MIKNTICKVCFALFTFLCSYTVAVAQSNQYLDFDGTDDFVTSPNASALIAGSNAFSITGWFWDNQLAYGQGLMGIRSTNAGFYLIQLNNGQLECRMQNSSGVLYDYKSPNFTIVPQTWQHIAWVYGSNLLSLYVNGNLVGTKAAAGTITNTTVPFAIGKSILNGFNFVYSGRIDEVTMWNKALSQTEIQDMMANELTGSEPGLQLYFKCNQGVPGGNNTGIASLTTSLNSPTYDGAFNNFALTGATSNFNGTLNNSFQAISFPQVPPQLTTLPSYYLNATATSGLPCTYTVLAGPCSISNDTAYFSGPGTVTIQADQFGNGTYDTAVAVVNTFDVVDPYANLAVIDPRNPVNNTDIYMPTLGALQLAAIANMPYPTLFNITDLEFVINGTSYPAHDYGNGHYTAWWTPTAYGTQTIDIKATSNYGVISTNTVTVNVVQSVSTLPSVPAFSGLWLNSTTGSLTADGILPSYVGAFDTILTTLSVTCPPNGGCDPWDRVSSVDVLGMNGQWYEVIRYITPYGVACNHTINLGDYMSMLQGKVTFRVNLGTLTNGFLYAMNLNYHAGTPPHRYSKVDKVWKAIYPFGDMANLQPVPAAPHTFEATAVAAKLKLVSTGHGWGNLNTANAAEFYNATHHVWVNGNQTFTQNNWTVCNPNPDACMPQNGTWTYNRAGWCPGSIAKPFDYDMSAYVGNPSVNLEYKFQSSYIDQCHPNNPNCQTGITCSDCNDGFNPTLDVNCNLVTWFDDATVLSTPEINTMRVLVYPNPSNGIFTLHSINAIETEHDVLINDVLGSSVKQFTWNGDKTNVDLTSLAKGVYVIKVVGSKESYQHKVVIK
ncbi:MAG: T9SS type A sorting domain-containing protein [Bacteroidetes bacterium]|nr:T9SS type A sorting domain-containing protein [Bacteroidota bacterium]